ncbi:TRAP transporter substrate-binding protein [Halomonas litopenaei]|uniref:TRAP transporter substrate-binding protein n=1 Tax=Halomonas litopenaei TaxID=2109328 RepID=UPI003FA17A43
MNYSLSRRRFIASASPVLSPIMAIALTTTLVTGLLTTTTTQAAETLRLGHYFPAEDFRGRTTQYLADQLDPSLLEIDVFPSESLVKGRDGLMGTARGTVDLYSLFGGYVVGTVGMMKIFTVPFPPDSLDDADVLAFANDPRVLEPLGEAFAASQVKLLGFINSSGQTTLFLAEPITGLDALEGRKIRGVGGYTDPALEDLGATVVFMSAAEQFLQLQTGGVDGVITTDSSYVNLGLSEVAPVVLASSMVRTPYPLIMNLRKYNGLSQEARDELHRAVDATIEWSSANFTEESARLHQAVDEQAETVYTFSEEDLTLANSLRDKYLSAYIEEFGESADALVEVYRSYLQ